MTAAAFLLFVGAMLIYAGWGNYSFMRMLGGDLVKAGEEGTPSSSLEGTE